MNQNKKILTAIILVVLLAITGYIYYRNRFPATPPVSQPSTQTGNQIFHGPTSQPYVKGPTGLPPGKQ